MVHERWHDIRGGSCCRSSHVVEKIAKRPTCIYTNNAREEGVQGLMMQLPTKDGGVLGLMAHALSVLLCLFVRDCLSILIPFLRHPRLVVLAIHTGKKKGGGLDKL